MHVVDINLFCPEHPRERLPLHALLVVGRALRLNLLIELIGLAAPRLDDLVEALERVVQKFIREAQANGDGSPRRDV